MVTNTIQMGSVQALSVDSTQKAWDKALELFNKDALAVDAIRPVWKALPLPRPLNACARIIGAVYANTYWDVTKMNAERLALDMSAAGGWNIEDCRNAARDAFSKWYGLQVRSNFSDDSRIPKLGSIFESPDVIVNGLTSLSVDQLITMWNQRVWGPMPGIDNTAYGRAQSVNIKVPINKPILRMYYSDNGLNPPPNSWVQIFTAEGESAVPMETMTSDVINPDDRAASSEAFDFLVPGVGHYCIIAIAGTEYFDNKPNTGGNWNSQEWIANNGAAGWHNLDVFQGGQTVLRFHNQDARTESFALEAHCDHLPAGTIVSLQCRDNRLAVPLTTGPVKIARDQQVVGTEVELPANFSGDLVVTVETPNGKPLLAGSSVEVRMSWILPYGHDRYADAVDQIGASRAAAFKQSVRVYLSSYTFVSGKG